MYKRQDETFAAGIIMDSDLDDIRYLYQFGEYISENELQTARHLMKLDDAVIKRMADVYTEGYRIGFVTVSYTHLDVYKRQCEYHTF